MDLLMWGERRWDLGSWIRFKQVDRHICLLAARHEQIVWNMTGISCRFFHRRLSFWLDWCSIIEDLTTRQKRQLGCVVLIPPACRIGGDGGKPADNDISCWRSRLGIIAIIWDSYFVLINIKKALSNVARLYARIVDLLHFSIPARPGEFETRLGGWWKVTNMMVAG